MDAVQACTLLSADGFSVEPGSVRLEAREDCWAAFLPGNRLAWFPMNTGGVQRLGLERQILRLLATRCSFQVPRVLFVAEAGWEVRALVPGLCDPWGLYCQARGDRALARRIGQALGSILAEQHVRVHREDTLGWLPDRLRWPEPDDWIRARLPHVVQNSGLLRLMDHALKRYRELESLGDGVLVHGDLGLHNIAVEPQTGDVLGVFDYGGAAWTDRHHDFRYLIFDSEGEDALEGALAVYEPALGMQLDRSRIRLFNSICAISYLAFRCGTRPEVRSCGRTLAEDLAWARFSLNRAGELVT